jgi:UDP-2,3-diacylglucosamine pyrophosphatase LpxH
MENIESKKIFLIGDIINASASKEHPDVIKFITLLNSKPWDIIYIEGNHEEDRNKFPPLSLSFNKNLFPISNYIYDNGNKKIYIEHGHKFHETNIINIIIKKLAVALRFRNGKKEIKRKSQSKRKSFYNRVMKPLAQKLLIYSFQSYMVSATQKKSCSVAICGHFHVPDDKKIKDIRYLNCGDWIKHNSYIAEDMNGNFLLISS